MNAGELDGVIIAEDGRNGFVKAVVQVCKLYGIPKVGIINVNSFNPLYMLNTNKIYMPYLETNIADGCNLNCKGCMHFAALFKTSEVYSIETFRRDVRQLAQTVDVGKFRLLGGEPLLLKNLDEYINISRQYLSRSDLRIITNGLSVRLILPATSCPKSSVLKILLRRRASIFTRRIFLRCSPCLTVM